MFFYLGLAVEYYNVSVPPRKGLSLSGLWDFRAGILWAENNKEGIAMRGYFTAAGYYGLVDGRYMLFSCESEYYEYMDAEQEQDAS